MRFNTTKTVFGFVGTLLRKYTGWRSQESSLDSIYNYLPISGRLSTSGQPTETQFDAIKANGYTVVVNLAPADSQNAIADEAGVLARLELKYVHLPVDFQNPTPTDFHEFVRIMQEHKSEKIWLHCAANMRVSAFLYRYRCSVLAEDAVVAREDLEKIWQPFGVWEEFTFGTATG